MNSPTITAPSSDKTPQELAAEVHGRALTFFQSMLAPEVAAAAKAGDQQLVDVIISRGLLAIHQYQTALGLPPESPAAVTGPDNKLLSIAAAGTTLARDASNLAVLVAMREAAQTTGVYQFDKLGYSAHLLGAPIRGGGLYNFGPSRAVITPFPGDIQIPGRDLRDDYWVEARKSRSMELVTMLPLGEGERLFDLGTLAMPANYRLPRPRTIEQPPVVQEVFDRWKNVELPRDAKGFIDIKSDIVAALMVDLHELAAASVDAGGGPFAGLVALPFGRIIAFGVNRVRLSLDATAHGERSAINNSLLIVQNTAQFGDYVNRLQGCTLITSSEDCISCGEQAELMGISHIIYGNPKKTVQDIVGFTEGPKRPHSEIGIRVDRVACDERIETAALWKFQRLVTGDPSLGYLQDHGKQTSTL